MKQFIDFLPLIIFFIVAKMDPREVSAFGQTFELGGIISATAVLIATSIIVYGLLWYKQKSLEKSQMITVVAVLLLGGMTVLFQDETFLKWKAPIVNWLFATAFLASRFIGQKTLIERMMDHAMTLPPPVWSKLNMSWVIFFALLGGANWFAAFMIPGDFWVDFKVFGNLGLTFAFVIIQMLFLGRYIKEDEAEKSP
ncbi:septation protein IspZ [Sansalvadorimonas sp. 2012CJ34-2]|uniref:Inner membrane-spanning protein YciB n=1 Tax=Parendozoicomonas callyspongiae TaxID=2942213 RepID=A0ABT0PHU4_9GAMM|nr:septation protein IspZ [Sansalvadorimonas sp. 2012CJ34-2]MCL6270929.1 septation protein IspZ [Sansalvadorimonas sp. 2012CJ34-2]